MKTYNPIQHKTMLLLKVIGVIILCISGLVFQGFAQVEVKNTQKETLKHVKMEIEHRGLHCPFLGVALKDKLKNMEGFKDFYIDKDDKFLTFTYPATMPITQEELMKIPIDIGFSESIVHVAIADQPFEVDSGQRAKDQ